MLRTSVFLAAAILPLAPATAATLVLEAGTGRVLHLQGRATSVFAADPKVAEVRPASPDSLFVFGVAAGHTSIAALAANGRAVGSYDVTVAPAGYAARSAGAAIHAAQPDAQIATGELQHGVSLSGIAATPADAEQAAALATDSAGAGQVRNNLAVRGSIQVSLRVRIAEMSRSLTRELGINWQSVNQLGTQAVLGVSGVAPLAALGNLQSSISFLSRFKLAGRPVALDTVIDALSQDQLVRMLAEPNLTTMSGEPASFLVGGEFPVPVASSNNDVTVSFKQYGISLAFVPTVLSDGQINLHVRPEVSELTNQGAVSISAGNQAIQIPALTVRRADTTVQLGSGQSFAIAGLLQDSATTTALGLPFLGDVPVLGALFRSSSFQRNQTELVIVVTPYIVHPADSPAALPLPTDTASVPNDLERIVLLRQVGRATKADAGPIPGDAGFAVE